MVKCDMFYDIIVLNVWQCFPRSYITGDWGCFGDIFIDLHVFFWSYSFDFLFYYSIQYVSSEFWIFNCEYLYSSWYHQKCYELGPYFIDRDIWWRTLTHKHIQTHTDSDIHSDRLRHTHRRQHTHTLNDSVHATAVEAQGWRDGIEMK